MLVVKILMTLLLILAIFSSNNLLTLIHIDATKKILTANDFIIQNSSSFIDESSIMHVYGEIKNISNKSFTNMTAKGSFYDSNGNLLNEYQRSCELPIVISGRICPFEILYIDTETTKSIKNFKLSALGIPTDTTKPAVLKVYPDNSKLDILGFYYINGRISNEGSLTATETSIVGTLYDKEGKIIALGRALAEPLNIPPGNQASFGIAVTEKSQTHKIERYSLMAYSDQYLS